MALLNYTTSIESDKTLHEIQRILAKAGALAIMTEFDADGEVEAVSFQIKAPHGPMSYTLPCNLVPVLKILDQESRAGKVPRRLVTKAQAGRVGWRIVKDWIEAQVALVQTQMVSLDQVFLPYVRTSNGQTLYQRYLEQGLPLLTASRRTEDAEPKIVS